MNQEYAFPQSLQAGDMAQSTGGLKLRDYFAAQALQGLLSNNHAMNVLRDCTDEERNIAAVCSEACYAMADAMLAERAKGASNG